MYSQPLTIRFGAGEVSLVLGGKVRHMPTRMTEKVTRGNMCASSYPVAFINRSSQVDCKRVGYPDALQPIDERYAVA